MKDLIFFLKLFARQWVWLAGGMVLTLLATFAAISLLTLSGWFVTASAIAGNAAVEGVAITFNFLVPAAQIRALAISRTLGRYAERLVTHEATFRVLADIRCWFFAQVIPLVPGRLSLIRSSDLLARMTADIDALDGLYLRLISPITVAAVGLIAIAFFLNGFAPAIAGLFTSMFLLAGALVPVVFNRLGQSGAERIIDLGAEFRMRQIDLVQGYPDLLSNGALTRFQKILTHCSNSLIDTQRQNNRLSGLSSALTLWLAQVTVLASLLAVAGLMRTGFVSGAEAALIVFCVMAAFEWVAPLPQALQMLGKIVKAAHRIRGVTKQTPVIIEPKTPVTLPEKFDITLLNVSFKYPEQQHWLLDNVSLKLPAGKKIAIVGPSGLGKSTLLNLLLRFYEPSAGIIELGSKDYKSLNSSQLIKRFAVLSQHSPLFTGTIKDNLLLAKPEATENEILLAVNAAGLGKTLKALPEGLKTWVGENGIQVSGGEARRIALARIYLKDAPILLLDEPTEGLDSETEKDVLNTLLKMSRKKTLVLVTHRAAGLVLVDEVLTIEDGKLIKIQ